MWKPDGTGKDRKQPPDLPDAFPVERALTPYPWFVVDGKVVKVEIRCAVCHQGLCARSMAVKLKEFALPCIFVPVCTKCRDRIIANHEYQPNDHLNYPDQASSRCEEAG